MLSWRDFFWLILLLTGCGPSSDSAPQRAAIPVPPGAPESIRLAVEGLNSPQPLTRAYAATQLGRSGEGNDLAADCLLAVLPDPNPMVRAAAADALGVVGGPRAVDPLIARLKDVGEDRDVRSRAAESLGRLQAAEAIDPLIAALNDTVWHLRYHAVVALGRIGDARAAPALEHAVRYDPDHSVRVAAEESLRTLGQPPPGGT